MMAKYFFWIFYVAAAGLTNKQTNRIKADATSFLTRGSPLFYVKATQLEYFLLMLIIKPLEACN